MSTPDTSTDAVAASRRSAADALANGSAILGPALISTVNQPRWNAGQVECNMYWLTDRGYQSVFLTTCDGRVLFDAPPSVRQNTQQTVRRAVDYVAAANGATNKVDRDLGQ